MVRTLSKIDAKKMTQISNDWQTQFPTLKRTRKGQFMRRIGPILIIVYLIKKYGVEYEPCSYIYGLIKEDQDFISAHIERRPETTHCYAVSWETHTKKQRYIASAEELRANSPIPLEGPVTLSAIIHAYKSEISGDCGSTWVFTIDDIEDVCLICGYVGRPELGLEMLDWVRPYYEELLEWHINSVKEAKEEGLPRSEIEWRQGKIDRIDIPAWYEKMKHRIQDRDRLINLVEQQLKFFKLENVPNEDIIVDI